MTTATGSVGRRSGLFVVSRLIASTGFFVAVVLLAHGLEPSGRGAVAFLTVTALTASAVVRLGVGDATVVFGARGPARRRELFSNLLLWTLVSSSIGGCVAAAILLMAGDQRPTGIGPPEIIAVALGTVFSALVDAGYPMLLASARVREMATITAAGPWRYAGVVAGTALTGGLTIIAAAIAWVISQGVWAAAIWFASVRGIGLGRPNGALLLEMVSFGLQAWVGNLAYFLNARFDQLLVGILASTSSLGAYAVAVNAAEVALYIPTASAQALLSAVARDAPDTRAARVTLAFRAALLATVAVSALAALSGPLVVPLIFGAGYGGAVLPFLLLLPGGIGFAAISILSSGLLLASSPRLASVGPAVSLIAGVALDFALIPLLGVQGAAVAATAALLAGGAATLISYKTRMKVSWNSFVPTTSDVALLRSFASTAMRWLVRRSA